MVANAIAAGYLVLSLPFSAAVVLRPQAIGLRHLLLICDLVGYGYPVLLRHVLLTANNLVFNFAVSCCRS